MLHGHTRIVLRNPISGNILKDVESENTFQPTALQNFTHCLGEDLHSIPSYDWEDLVGGIFLFKNTITIQNDVRSWYMPVGNVMIGNSAVGISNSAAPTELGSYNAVESSASTSGIKQVYDFTTSQANGQISCVCLTSKVGGQVGYGNLTGRRTDVAIGSGQSGAIYGAVNSAIVDNMLYTFTLSGNILTVRKTRKSLVQGSVFSGLYSTTTIDLSSIKPVGETLSETLSVFAMNDDTIRIYSQINSSAASSDTIYFFDYDPSDDSVVLGSFTNSASKAVRTDIVAISFTPDDYCITYDGDRYLQVFKISNSSHVFDYTVEPLLANDRYGNFDTPLSDGLILNYGTGNGYIVDYINGTVKPVNVSISGNYQIFNKRFPSIDALSHGSGNTTMLIKNPLYLATINNLQSPVNKTNAATMKVTYTLTEV